VVDGTAAAAARATAARLALQEMGMAFSGLPRG
jgi:hypothetical protein